MKKYLFGVRSEFNTNKMESKLTSDFLLEIPNDKKYHTHIDEMKAMIENKMCQTTYKEAIEVFGFSSLNTQLIGIKYRVKANNLSVHLIETETSIDRECFDNWIALANIDSSTRTFLKDSKINI